MLVMYCLIVRVLLVGEAFCKMDRSVEIVKLNVFCALILLHVLIVLMDIILVEEIVLVVYRNVLCVPLLVTVQLV